MFDEIPLKTFKACFNLYLLAFKVCSVKIGHLLGLHPQHILKQCGRSILKWLDEVNHEGLSKDEALQMMATVMRIQGNRSWFEPDNEGV